MAEASVGDIVGRLRIDTAPWQQGLQQAAQQLNQFSQGLSGRLTPALQQAQQSLTTMHQAAGQIGERFQTATRATSGWTQALQVAAGIGIATSIAGIVSSLSAFISSTIQVGTRLEAMRASFGAIAGSSAAGQQQFQMLADTAQRLGVALDPLARGWRTLTAAASQANLPLADQQRLLTVLATEARRVGASNEELNRALLAVSQMASKGRISMEELRQQLGEALPTAMAAAARGLGRTTEELTKLVETGSVRFPAFARALTRGFEEMQSGANAAAETSQAAFNRLGNALTLFKDALAANILPEMARLARIAQTILETATNLVRVTGGQTGGAVGPSLGALGATPQQQSEVDRLNRVIAQLEARQGAGTPLMQQTTAAQLANAKELRDQVLESLRATTDQATAQSAVTAEVNKTATARQLEADYVADVQRKLGELRQAQEAFRKEAALSPERLGRPGTTDFLTNMQQVTGKQLEDLTKLIAAPPQGVTLPEALRRQLAAVDAQYGQLGRTIEGIKTKDQERRRAEREAEQALRQEERRDAQQVLQERQERIRNLDIFGLLLSPEQEQDLKDQAREQRERIREFARSGDLLGLEVSPEVERQRRLAADFTMRLQGDLDTTLANREQRPEARLRARALRQGVEITPEHDAMLRRLTALREEQERLNQVVGIWNDLAQGVGSAWTSALSSIADGTATVASAFRAMGQSILKTMSDIAAQQAFQAIFKLGVGLLTGAMMPATGAATTGSEIGPILFQGGGVVHGPTLAMLGENAANNPEVVLNRHQMQSMMRTGTQAGASVTVINVPNTQAAEQTAAQERALGRQVVINYVLDELSTGESSRINRTLRAMQR